MFELKILIFYVIFERNFFVHHEVKDYTNRVDVNLEWIVDGMLNFLENFRSCVLECPTIGLDY